LENHKKRVVDKNSIRILTSLHTLPDVKSIKTQFFDNFLEEMKQSFNVEMIWLVYLPIKIKEKRNSNETILDIHNFDNAVEVIKKINPDLVFTDPGIGHIHLALSSAAKFLNIPVICGIQNILNPVRFSQSKLIKSWFSQFFSSSTPTQIENKEIFGRGRFFSYKWLFLIKTQIKTDISKIIFIKKFFSLLKMYLIGVGNDPQFAGTLNWVQSENLEKSLLKIGFKKSSLTITGDPMYDKVFKKIKKIKDMKYEQKKRKTVLFITSPHVEHGFLTKEKRNKIILDIVNNILNHKDQFELKIKIHPSTENIIEYEALLKKWHHDIPVFQKGDILDYIENADIIISFSIATSANTYALIVEKPIVIYDFYNIESGEFYTRKLVEKCTNSSEIIPSIFKVLLENPSKSERAKKFVNEFFYKTDGNASKRLVKSITEFLKNSN
jgi:hypothetical protein